MKEGSWDECLETKSSVSVSRDKAKAGSLSDTAQARITFLKQNKLNEQNASFIFENYYSSVLELLHAIVILKGFKVTNHICLGYYLRDVMKREDLFRDFNDFRFKRNSIIYYGNKLDFNVAKESINRIISFIQKLSLLLEKEIQKT